MFKLLIVIVFMFIFFKMNTNRKEGWKNPSSLLIGIYLLASIFSVPNLLINGDSSNAKLTMVYQEKYWFGVFAFIILIFLFLYPFYRFKENNVKEIAIPSDQVLEVFSCTVIVLSFFAIIYSIPTVVSLFRSGVALRVLRNNFGNVRESYVSTSGISNTIASVASSMYPFAIMLFYIYYIKGKHPIKCLLLFISSSSNIFHVLTFVGRDGVVFWMLSFLSMHFFFRDYLNIYQRKTVRRVFIVAAIVALLPFIAISISRFSSYSAENGTIKSILSYLGQMIPNYLLYFDIRMDHYNYGVSFPLFWEITGQQQPTSVRWMDGGTESNVFGTFLKSFNINFGVLGTLIVALIAGFLFLRVFNKRKETFYFHQYFLYILYFKILSEGVFYFRDYTRGGNLFILICFLLFVVFSVIERYFGTYTLQKNEAAIDYDKRKRIRFVFGHRRQ